MRTKYLLGILILFFCTFNFISCNNEDEEGRKITDYKEYVLTVASKKVPGVVSNGHYYLTDVYAVKKDQSNDWVSFGYIMGFDFEEEYEYKIKISETTFLDHSMGDPAWTEHELLEIISKEKKDSEDLPLHLISESYYKDRFLPEYRYAIEADNKELIEKDLKENPILPLDYHYLIYSGENGVLKWIAIKDDHNLLGSGIIKRTNKNPEEKPDSYDILPPEGQVIGFMELDFLDEAGNETVYPSFDVFLGNLKNYGDRIPTLAYLYKDLTEYYKNKYPNAGVKTIVISYIFSIK